MSQMDWSDRFLKRELSRLEKQSIFNTGGRAVIFPGSPNTEVEELLAVGFDHSHIYAIEHDQTAADALYEHYYDRCNVHWEEASIFLQRTLGPFSYVHLDYCGQFGQTELDGVEALRVKMEPISRVRISLYNSRRTNDQLAYERVFLERCTVAFLRAAMRMEAYRIDASMLHQAMFRGGDCDITLAILGVLLANFTFGMPVFEFIDLQDGDEWTIPAVQGTHRINSLRRFRYSEPGNSNGMATIWVDLVPLPHSSHLLEENWKWREVLHVLGMAAREPSTYANPALFN